MGVIGIIASLREALEAFIDNPNTTNQMVLERAMRVYQCNVTAVEPYPDMAAERAWREGNR